MSREKLCFVQFIHPGGEHRPDAPGVKYWNVGPHRRKFLRSSGVAVGAGQASHRGELVFWGEWEPESYVDAVESPVAEGPRFVHRPFYSDPPPKAWRQNTDPFVFGEQFHYTGCLQHTRYGPTQLRFLERGSVILFGSCLGRRKFVLDTLFVVDRWLDHARADHHVVCDGVSEVYRKATIDPWYSGRDSDSNSYRLYFGATPTRRSTRCLASSQPRRFLSAQAGSLARRFGWMSSRQISTKESGSTLKQAWLTFVDSGAQWSSRSRKPDWCSASAPIPRPRSAVSNPPLRLRDTELEGDEFWRKVGVPPGLWSEFNAHGLAPSGIAEPS